MTANPTCEHNSVDWCPLPSQLDDPLGGNQLSRQQARIWGLVLEARKIPFQTIRKGFGWQISVPTEWTALASKELRLYQLENNNWPPSPLPPTELIDNRFSTLCVLIAIGLFHNLTLQDIHVFGHNSVAWTEIGRLQVGKVMIGEWWRVVTALTLHADGLHLMGNLMIGGFFISRLCRVLGAGLGWLLLLLSGIAGNVMNVLLQAPDHVSVGASTAIFGAVGMLGAMSMVRYRHAQRLHKRWLMPLAGAIGLLAMLGVGGENTDLGAHLWGFLAGVLIGFVTEFFLNAFGRPGPAGNALLACIAVLTVTGAWIWAIAS
ncbi:MAG: rhomboid family intramembrane serine protease [Deltaproteobacteria bacterium]|jgi:membrane associated rhomboid family serine protease|nr:rhomboid family intramembrane serine protease [Deltaproteobacteria bacterium]